MIAGTVHTARAARDSVAAATVPEDSPCTFPPPHSSRTPTEAVAQNSAPELRRQASLDRSTPRSGRTRSDWPTPSRPLVPRLNLPPPTDISDTPPPAYLPSQHRWASVPLLRRAAATGSLDSQSSDDWLPPSSPQLTATGQPLHRIVQSSLMPSPFLTEGHSDSTSGDAWYTHAGEACATATTMFTVAADRPERSAPCGAPAEGTLTGGSHSHAQVGLSADCVAAYTHPSHACANEASPSGAAAPSERGPSPLGEPYALPPPAAPDVQRDTVEAWGMADADSATTEHPDAAYAISNTSQGEGASSKAGAPSAEASARSDGASRHANSNAENEGGASSAVSGLYSFSRTASQLTLDSEDDGRARSCPAGFMHDSDRSASADGDEPQPLLPIRLGGVRSAGARGWSRPAVEAALACDAIQEAPPPSSTASRDKPVDEEASVCGGVGDAAPANTDSDGESVAKGGLACGAIGGEPHIRATCEAEADQSVAHGADEDVHAQHGSASMSLRQPAAEDTTNPWEQCRSASVPLSDDSPLSGHSVLADGAFEEDFMCDDDASTDVSQYGDAYDSDVADECLPSAAGGLTATASPASDAWAPSPCLLEGLGDAVDGVKAAPLADPRPPLSARRVQSVAGSQVSNSNTRDAVEQVKTADVGKAAPGATAESTLVVDPVDACSSFGADDGSCDGMGARVDVGAARFTFHLLPLHLPLPAVKHMTQCTCIPMHRPQLAVVFRPVTYHTHKAHACTCCLSVDPPVCCA